MRLSSKARYAVMAMVDLARREPGKPVSLAEIAEGQEISFSYLEQMFAALRRAGIVRSVRGPGGGYGLAHPANDISIADIVSATETGPAPANTACDPGNPANCPIADARCATHGLWAALDEEMARFLSSISLDAVAHGEFAGAARFLDMKRDLAATGE